MPSFCCAILGLITRYPHRVLRVDLGPVDACLSQVYSETRLVADTAFGYFVAKP